MTIAIAGGTGKLGSLVVNGLRAQGQTIRVLTRDKARADALQGVEVVIGDVRDRASLDPFVEGAGVVISAVHGFVGTGGVSPANVDRDGNMKLIDAAKAAGADVVMVSVDGSAPDHPMSLMRMKYAAEEYLKASGVRYTIVRAPAFMETWIDVLVQTANAKHGPLIFGRGENPINFVAIPDVAALIQRVVLDPTTRGETMAIGGPEDITLTDLAARVSAARGLGKPKRIPTIALRIASVTVGLVKPAVGRQVRGALAMDRMNGRLGGPNARDRFPDLPSTPIADVLG